MYAMENEAMVFAKTPAHQIAEKNQSLGKGGPQWLASVANCFFLLSDISQMGNQIQLLDEESF